MSPLSIQVVWVNILDNNLLRVLVQLKATCLNLEPHEVVYPQPHSYIILQHRDNHIVQIVPEIVFLKLEGFKLLFKYFELTGAFGKNLLRPNSVKVFPGSLIQTRFPYDLKVTKK